MIVGVGMAIANISYGPMSTSAVPYISEILLIDLSQTLTWATRDFGVLPVAVIGNTAVLEYGTGARVVTTRVTNNCLFPLHYSPDTVEKQLMCCVWLNKHSDQ